MSREAKAIRRQGLTQDEKKAFRDYYFSLTEKPTQKDLIDWFKEHFGRTLAQSTVSTILSPKHAYLDSQDFIRGDLKRNRTPKYPALESALFEWQQQEEKRSGTVSCDQLRLAALDIWKTIPEYQNIPTPSFSNGWLEKFKRRHPLSELYKEPDPLMADVINTRKIPIQEVTKHYAPSDIFVMDEGSLFWKLTPQKSISIENVLGIQRYRARFTITLCCNADASERLPLWVVGYSKRPKAFRSKNVYPEAMNVQWRSNGTAWVTNSLMEEWLRWFDEKMKGRKVLLLLDSLSPHECALEAIRNSNNNLKHVKVAFLTSESRNITHPFDCGIMETFKTHYRLRWARYMYTEMQSQKDPLKTVNVYKALQWITESWHVDISNEDIITCFQRSGVFADDGKPKRVIPYSLIAEIETILPRICPPPMCSIEEFLMPAEEEVVDSKEDVVNQVASQFLPERDQETDEEDERGFYVPPNEALSALNTFLQYYYQQPIEDGSVIPTLLRFRRQLRGLANHIQTS
ncbi:ARS-binding protein [Schizosaccharomyces octosporus yFS286]|uniref:ARS-binding protein n=1 Tax=Schizosaccharomyces octosporus (strain yFS286) TaxID=483514 RepID=S9PVC1_SCHOY|nr:ARS-binding protein [Schizosaccharomyces octosporus yFS286]EPX73046.1 ARS-binding protein [Schizosaccharomyces octosporus yFS286]